jgi:hypothetical protein
VWLAEAPRPLSATASVPGLSVTARARPASYLWDFGDGDALTTTTPGRYDPRSHSGPIAHTYEASGRYRVTVELYWEAAYRLGRGPWQELGYFRTFASRPYPVREVVTRLVFSEH